MESGTIEEDVKPTEQEIKQRRKSDDSDEMVRATMNTYGVTSANHTYPILKTVGLSFCVGVALYDPDSKVAGLIHIIEPDRSRDYSAMVSIKNDIKNMLTTMEKHGVTIEARKKIQAHIIAGNTRGRRRRCLKTDFSPISPIFFLIYVQSVTRPFFVMNPFLMSFATFLFAVLFS